MLMQQPRISTLDATLDACASHSTLSLRPLIYGEIAAVAELRDLQAADLDDDVPLVACGLDSLGLATLVARLEDETGLDPLAEDHGCDFPVTLGDFVRLYDRAARAAG